MRFFSKIKNSTLLVYAAVLLTPILIIFAVYQNSVRVASTKAESGFDTAMVQVKHYVDTEILSPDKIYSQITLFQNFECLYPNQGEISQAQLFYLYKLIPHLRAFTASNNRIDSVYLYFPGSDFIVSGSGSFDKKTIDHWFNCASGLDKQKIMSMVSKNNNASFAPVNFTDTSSNTGLVQRQAMIAYIRPIVPVSNQTPPVIVIVFMKQSEILNAYNNLFTATYGSVSTISADSKFLFNSAPNYLVGKDYAFFAQRGKPQTSFVLKSNGESYKVNNIQSDVADWNYILSVPVNVYAANISEITNATLICILVYIVVAFLAAWYFYKKNYKPLHKLIELFRKVGKGDKEPENGFSYIEHSVKDILDDNQKINDILLKQKDSLRHGILLRLINGNNQNEDWELPVSEAGLCLNKPNNFIFLIYLVYPDDMQETAKEPMSCCAQVHSMISDGFQDVENIYVLCSENLYICVANTDVDMSVVLARASQICSSITQAVVDDSSACYTIAFSGRHDSLDDFSKAYAEALELKEYKTFLGAPNLSLYDEMRANFNASSPYIGDIETELMIINHIKSQEYEPAIELINKQMNSILQLTTLPLALVKCRMFGVINLLLSIVSEMRSMYDFKFMKEVNAAEVLLGCKSIRELQSCMNDIFDQMRDYIQQKERDLDSSRMRAIMDFVKDNYNRPDMSIMYLSQVFNKNESYISRSFKRYVGMGFLDYLHALRIVEAKRLLKDGMHIKDAALVVGYTNDITLIRAFKRYEGMTPGKFKSGDTLKSIQVARNDAQ